MCLYLRILKMSKHLRNFDERYFSSQNSQKLHNFLNGDTLIRACCSVLELSISIITATGRFKIGLN